MAMQKLGNGPVVLIIDQDKTLAEKLSAPLAENGVLLEYASSIDQGAVLLKSGEIEAVLIRDEIDGGLNGQSIATFQSGSRSPEVIVFTTQGSSEQVEKAIKLGVWEYVIDSSLEKHLPKIIERALHYRDNKTFEPAGNHKEIRSQLEETGIIGRSKTMQMCIDQAIVIAQSEANVLIYGESGTGKELFASTIHELSSRSSRPLTIVDCAALPPSLVESILFGHIKGSFTGADRAQRGLVEQADGGTLFLDEIGEIPPAMQKKLLRVIQEHTYLPVGSSTERNSDFRLIAATNKDLQSMVEAEMFREDLLFRLKTFFLELPPLRNRIADITELAYYYRDLFCKQQRLRRKKFSPDYLLLLSQYEWPGNVRELFQAIERSITEAQESDTLYAVHLPPEIRIRSLQKKLDDTEEEQDIGANGIIHGETDHEFSTLREVREKAIENCEKTYLQKLLHQNGGDIKKCCSISGLSRSRLYDLLKKYNLIRRKSAVSKSTETG